MNKRNNGAVTAKAPGADVDFFGVSLSEKKNMDRLFWTLSPFGLLVFVQKRQERVQDPVKFRGE